VTQPVDGTERLQAAARKKSEVKFQAAADAIAGLVQRGEPVTFQAVQRAAGVSHTFLYSNAQLRDRIENLRGSSPRAVRVVAEDDSESNVVVVLTLKLEALRRQHRDEISGLRRALEEAHGENLVLRRQLAVHGIAPPTSVVSDAAGA
jgi:hypothetical protein